MRQKTFIIHLYQMLDVLLKPVYFYVLWMRTIKKREDPARIGERKGYASKKRPDGKLIWIHAASVGEALSILPMAHMFGSKQNHSVLLTTVTFNAANAIERRIMQGFLPNTLHQYMPLDHHSFMKRFLDHWQPNMALLVESEIWPNMVCCSFDRKIPLGIVNARLSKTAARRWGFAKKTASYLFNCFSFIGAQDKFCAKRLAQLGIHHFIQTGNLKFDSLLLPVNEAQLAGWRVKIGRRPIFLCASTSAGEEEILIASHKELQKTIPNLLTILIPRHPRRRGQLVLDMARKQGFYAICYTQEEKLSDKTEIYVADVIGKMGLFYRLANVAFVGGSLNKKRGGQNPLEPIMLGCALLHGPYVRNFESIYNIIDDAKAGIMVKDEIDIVKIVKKLLSDGQACLDMQKNVQIMLGEHKGATKRTVEALEQILET